MKTYRIVHKDRDKKPEKISEAQKKQIDKVINTVKFIMIGEITIATSEIKRIEPIEKEKDLPLYLNEPNEPSITKAELKKFIMSWSDKPWGRKSKNSQ